MMKNQFFIKNKFRILGVGAVCLTLVGASMALPHFRRSSGRESQSGEGGMAAGSEASGAESSSEYVLNLDDFDDNPESTAFTVVALSPDGSAFPNLNVALPTLEPAPEYLRVGVGHAIVAKLQQRLMDLGFMEQDEPQLRSEERR